ncbi:response regulator transcription factor [Salipaludibacillus sp. LMS25]|jgi:two-component system response regulator YesN|uniref:response regulator transcription factor n=1 Tax=Salipaludibacillus sp. LMS25 TaxID=2924031 RepID=UPI0020D04E7F|nr:response regulator transcription factor [Salipaludibacillus sp. LMS25]UTR13592.1 response regulator transcription factor [Salipaludibacillus sp. LMS25]
MYNVLIVDDEPIVREGLKTIISWENYGFHVTGTAEDGEAALEKYDDLSPDLIISDIRMTGMDGLEFIEAVRETDQRVRCLLLSGYADFDYARQAIEHNVAGYLLKPVDEEELIDYLIRIKSELKQEEERSLLTKHGQEKRQEDVLTSLIMTPPMLKREKEHLIQHAKKVGLDWGSYDMLVITVKQRETGEVLWRTAKEMVITLVQNLPEKIVFFHEPYVGILLNGSLAFKGKYDLFKKIKSVMEDEGYYMVAALGGSVERLETVHTSFATARTLIQKKFFYPPGELLYAEKENDSGGEATSDCDTLAYQLYAALEVGVYQSVPSLIKEIRFAGDFNACERTVKQRYVTVLTTVLNKLRASKSDKEKLITHALDKVTRIHSIDHIEDLLQFSEELISCLFTQLDYSEADDQLKKLLFMMETHYNENLKLEKLAGIFNYNSAYLGKLFKRYTGDYFNTYLDHVRIRHAKEYLLQGYKVYEVAEMVGYSHVDYFHSKFKKYVGISPSKYRKSTT